MTDRSKNILTFPTLQDANGRASGAPHKQSPAELLSKIMSEATEPPTPRQETVVTEQSIQGDNNIQITVGTVRKQVIQGSGNVQIAGAADLRSNVKGAG